MDKKTQGISRRPQQSSPHAQHRVDVAADPLDVGGHQVGLGGLLTQTLHHGLHGGEDALLLVRGVQVGHVARVQDAVHILQERLALYLQGGGLGNQPSIGQRKATHVLLSTQQLFLYVNLNVCSINLGIMNAWNLLY